MFPSVILLLFHSDPQYFPIHLLPLSHTINIYTISTIHSLRINCTCPFVLQSQTFPNSNSFCPHRLPYHRLLKVSSVSCGIHDGGGNGLFQRELLEVAFLCCCLGDFGELSCGGHCGLVIFMSSSTLKAFCGECACGGHTTDILLQLSLFSSIDFINSFSRVSFSVEPMLLCEYLQSSCSDEVMSLPFSLTFFSL